MYKRLDSNYEVSSEGEVRNIKTGNILKGKYKNGYKHVNLSYGKIKKTCQVHGLAASLFIPNPDNYPVINHKDENPSNNRAENLEWCTQSYNKGYMFTTKSAGGYVWEFQESNH